MLNKSFLTLLSLIVILAVVGISGCTSSGSSNSELEEYVTGAYNDSGVSFTVPDGWKAYKESGNKVAQAVGDNVRLYIYRYDGSYETAKDTADTQAEHFRYWNNEPIVTSVSINGDKGYSVFGYDGHEERYEDHYIVKKGNYIFDLDFSTVTDTDSVSGGIAVDRLSSSEVYQILGSFSA